MAKPKVPPRFLAAAIALFVVAGAAYFFKNFQEWVPWLTELELRSYKWVSRLDAREPRAQWVIAVEIDDRTFYDVLKLGSNEVTDRRALAGLVRSAAASSAAVIALDIDIVRENPDQTEPRKSANVVLLAAIREASARGIPVVLTCGFDNSGKQIPNIFDDSELPQFAQPGVLSRTRVGFDHLARDLRKLPLVVDRDSPSGREREYSSFALETVDAYEGTLGISPLTRDRLSKEISKREFIYFTFLRPEQFPHLSAADLLESRPGAERMLAHRIVLIGGNRHDRQGSDKWLDFHLYPSLSMTGLYFHANYIESLLDNRLKTPIPDRAASALDFVFAALVIVFSYGAQTLLRRLLRLSIFFIPIILAYVLFVNLGYVFGFVLPLLLLFIHAWVDHYLHLRRLAQATKEVVAHAG